MITVLYCFKCIIRNMSQRLLIDLSSQIVLELNWQNEPKKKKEKKYTSFHGLFGSLEGLNHLNFLS